MSQRNVYASPQHMASKRHSRHSRDFSSPSRALYGRACPVGDAVHAVQRPGSVSMRARVACAILAKQYPAPAETVGSMLRPMCFFQSHAMTDFIGWMGKPNRSVVENLSVKLYNSTITCRVDSVTHPCQYLH